jgi:hypothetical protein
VNATQHIVDPYNAAAIQRTLKHMDPEHNRSTLRITKDYCGIRVDGAGDEVPRPTPDLTVRAVRKMNQVPVTNLSRVGKASQFVTNKTSTIIQSLPSGLVFEAPSWVKTQFVGRAFKYVVNGGHYVAVPDQGRAQPGAPAKVIAHIKANDARLEFAIEKVQATPVREAWANNALCHLHGTPDGQYRHPATLNDGVLQHLACGRDVFWGELRLSSEALLAAVEETVPKIPLECANANPQFEERLSLLPPGTDAAVRWVPLMYTEDEIIDMITALVRT